MSQISRLRDAEISNGNLINADDIDTELNQLVSESNSQDTRLTNIESNTLTIGGVKSFSSAPKMDQIDERTGNAGVTIDSVLHKDGYIKVNPTVGYAPTGNGEIGYDSTSHTYDVMVNGSAKSLLHTGSGIDDLNDVTLTSPASGQGLTYNGSAWVNGTVGSMVLLSTATASNSATVDFTSSINSTYDMYVLAGVGIVPATDAVAAWLRVSEDAGSSWKSGASDYKHSGYVNGIAAGAGAAAGTGAAIVLTHDTTLSNNAANAFNFFATVSKPSSTTSKKEINFLPHGYVTSSGDYFTMMKTGSYVGTTNAITGLRFLMSSGNITSGSFYLYGVKKS
ncbi:MAG TPA: hypothetical protein V6C52_00720 [Coleofasciculaceae cyanobacterium]